MSDSASSPIRSWMEIAEEVSREQDPAKLSRLVRELNQALDEQGVGKLSTVRRTRPDCEAQKEGEAKPDRISPYFLDGLNEMSHASDA